MVSEHMHEKKHQPGTFWIVTVDWKVRKSMLLKGLVPSESGTSFPSFKTKCPSEHCHSTESFCTVKSVATAPSCDAAKTRPNPV